MVLCCSQPEDAWCEGRRLAFRVLPCCANALALPRRCPSPARPSACLQIEEARRREQADKIAAIHALERQSQEIMRHKQAMAALQTRIASMQSQLLVGGQKIEDTPQFRWVGGGRRGCWLAGLEGLGCLEANAGGFVWM